MRTLSPMVLKDAYFSKVEAEIRRILDDIIYGPLAEIAGLRLQALNRELKNSRSELYDAIAKGVIWYEDGEFKGRFNSRTSTAIIRLGGAFNVKSRTYSLPSAKIPSDLKFAQTHANAQYESMRARMLSALDNMNPDTVDSISRVKEEYEKALAHMEGDLQGKLPRDLPQKSDNPAISRIVVEAKLTDTQKKIIADDWGNNLDLDIKGWVEKDVLKLRQDIQPHVMAGGRAEGLVKTIQQNYGVSASKAKFLARQETALLMSKFQETRYRDIGIQRYRWSTAHDKRVRHDHHELDGKVFRFDSPPVTNHKTGARNNPGEDYNCRCVAIPLVE